MYVEKFSYSIVDEDGHSVHRCVLMGFKFMLSDKLGIRESCTIEDLRLNIIRI